MQYKVHCGLNEVYANPKIILQEKQISESVNNWTAVNNFIANASSNEIIRNMNQLSYGEDRQVWFSGRLITALPTHMQKQN